MSLNLNLSAVVIAGDGFSEDELQAGIDSFVGSLVAAGYSVTGKVATGETTRVIDQRPGAGEAEAGG